MNQYDVIHIDMAEMWSNIGKKEELFISSLNQTILEELQKEYSTVDISGCSTISMALSQINYVCKAQFVVIIDEWDTVFREAKQNKKQQDDIDYDKMREWYGGYSFKNAEHIYNPNSVVKAIRFEAFESYWSHTEAFSSLSGYISLNFEGLRDDIIRMFAGERCRVKVGNFENDFVSYKSKDDVMTERPKSIVAL